MVEEFIVPLHDDEIEIYKKNPTTAWGNNVTFYNHSISFEGYDLAIVGVKETRNSPFNIGSEEGPDVVRTSLYSLAKNAGNFSIIDIGNIEKGATAHDTYIAVKQVVNELIQHKIIPIIIGGTHDLTYGQYLAYQSFNKPINIVVADELVNLKTLGEPISDENFLMNIFTHEPNFLFNFSIIGYQSYFVNDEAIATMERLNFDWYRLGVVREKMEEIEPVLRDADFFSFDMQAIKSSDAPGTLNATPNGFYSEEACQLMRYAGLSERLTSLGLYQYNPAYDHRLQTAQLMGQMIWYFVDGFYARKNDNPAINEENFIKFIVDLQDSNMEMIFFKSKLSDRWWMQVHDPSSQKTQIIPCSYTDYKKATINELPDKWVKSLSRMV